MSVAQLKKAWQQLSQSPIIRSIASNVFTLYSLLILLFSFSTYFWGYQNPPALFWDENYHIAAAYKYMNNSFFLEPHPPMGKLMIAWSESMFGLNKNLDTKSFLNTDYVQQVPDGFSFAGVRFFPALLSFLAGIIFFWAFYKFVKNPHLAFVGATLYTFQNAFIVHSRGAMLEGIHLFFIALTLLAFAWSWQHEKIRLWEYALLGLLIGMCVSIKVNALVLIALPVFLALKQLQVNWNPFKTRILVHEFQQKHTWLRAGKLVAGLSIMSFVGVGWFVLIQGIHYNFAHENITNGYYDISVPTTGPLAQVCEQNGKDYQRSVEKQSATSPALSQTTTLAWYCYTDRYQKGVPKLDSSKPDENGSYPLLWIFGGKAISYRWEKYAVDKSQHNMYFGDPESAKITLDQYFKLPKDQQNKYEVVTKFMYLQSNPISWLASLFGLIFGIIILIYGIFAHLSEHEKRFHRLILVFVVLWLGYMLPVLQVERVLYMYHYFIPLIFGWILLLLSLSFMLDPKHMTAVKIRRLYIGIAIFGVINFLAFIYYMPFTYYMPMTEGEFAWRNLFNVWQLAYPK